MTRHRPTLAQDQNLAGKLRFDLDASRTLAWDKQFESQLQMLTPGVVTAAVRKYIDPSRITVVKAGDFAKVSQSN